MANSRTLRLSMEPDPETFSQLQKEVHSYTVVITPRTYTEEGLAFLCAMSKALPRHRFVLVVHKDHITNNVSKQCKVLDRARNVFIGYVGVGGKKSFDTVGEAYAELTRRATPASSLED